MSLQPKKQSRIGEPSTWAGFGQVIIGGIFGLQHPELADPSFWGAAAVVGTGLLSIFRRERG